MKPLLAIVGRPNVGKSTLFNRIIGRKKAITKDEPGVTRDINFGDAFEGGRYFSVVDTGGFEADVTEGIMVQIREQVRLAVEEADVIILLMDGRSGLVPQDRDLVELLRTSGKRVLYAVNKVDTPSQEASTADFYAIGVDEVMGVSAENGMGVAELVDRAVELLPDAEEEDAAVGTRVAIVGRPNVGKSSLLNRLLGKERSIVSDVSGTTRDSIDTHISVGGRDYTFIDTAGIRKKNRISLKVEAYSVMEAVRCIDKSDVVLLVIDGVEGLEGQDEKIAWLAENRSKAVIFVVNKWDIVEKDTDTQKEYIEDIREKATHMAYAPVVFLSALTGSRTERVFDVIDHVIEQGGIKVPTSKLNDAFKGITTRHLPPMYRGRPIKFYYITQVGTYPIRFAVFVNYPDGVGDSYKRYIMARLREVFSLDSVPIRVEFRSRR